MTEPTPSFEAASVAAILAQRSREDQAAMVADLVSTLSEIVPGAKVERALLRRHITAVRLPLGDLVYSLTRRSDGTFESSRLHQVRGVVIRSEPMEIDAFVIELGAAIDAELQRSERGRDALKRWFDSTNG